MKREDVKNKIPGITEEQLNWLMQENGSDITREKFLSTLSLRRAIRWGQPRPMRHFYPHPLTGNDWHLFMALVMLHKLLPMFVNRKPIVLGTGMAFLLAQTLVHLFHVLLLLFCAGNAYFISFCSVFSSSSTTSSFPARIPSATQVRIWFASSSRLNAFIAAVTAADCTRISGQYTSFSTIPRMPRICPSIRFSLWTRLLYSSSLRCFVLCAQQQHGSFFSFSCIMLPSHHMQGTPAGYIHYIPRRGTLSSR